MVNMLLTLVLLLVSSFQEQKPTDAPSSAPTETPAELYHDQVTIFGGKVNERADSIAATHPALEGMARKIHEDVDSALAKDSSAPNFYKELKAIQDELEHMIGEAWAIDNFQRS
jgi:hypothetical protein